MRDTHNILLIKYLNIAQFCTFKYSIDPLLNAIHYQKIVKNLELINLLSNTFFNLFQMTFANVLQQRVDIAREHGSSSI